jgi:sugar transferase (PEP-CTERM/EpsH1 system associated)
MRVVHLLRSLETGGQEVMCARLAERLDPRRFRPTVVALQPGGRLGEELRQCGIEVRCLNAREGFRPLLAAEVAGVLSRTGAEVLHCHNRKAFLYGALAARLTPRVRVVFTKHGASFWDPTLERLGRALVRRAHAVVAVSSDIAAPLERERWVPPERLHTILNGVDTERFRPRPARPEMLAALGFTREHRVIGTVARLSPEKDQATLLRAFAQVAAAAPEARLLIVGGGPERPRLEALTAGLGCEERVVFAGERSDIPDILNAMRVFALPSLAEGTSLTLLEAMASGLPVAATAVGGTPEVVAHGESGLLTPPARPDLLAAALLDLLLDPRRAQEMGEAGRAAVLDRYGLDAMVERYSRLYERLGTRG